VFDLLRPRPLVQVALALVGGAAAFYVAPLFSVCAAAAALVACLAFRRWWAAVALLFFALGWSLAGLERWHLDRQDELRVSEATELVGRVRWTGRSAEDAVFFILETNAQDDVVADALVAVYAPAHLDFVAGERVALLGTLRPVRSRYWRQMGLQAALRVREVACVARLAPTDTPALAALQRARSAAQASYTRFLPADKAGMLTAMVFGDYERAPERVRADMKRAGVFHLLATSGLHVGLVGGMLAWLLLSLRLPRSVALCAAIAVLFAYAVAAGARPSAMRAAVAVALYLAASLIRREPDTLTAIAGGAVYQVLHSPMSVMSAGFLLSYLTAAGLIAWTPQAARWLQRICRRRGDRLSVQVAYAAALSFVVSLLASAFSVPLLAYYFHQAPLLGPVANVVCVPVLAPILFAAWVGPVLWFVPGWPELWLGGVAGLGIEWVRWVSGVVGGLGWSVLSPAAFSPIWLWVYYLLAFGLAKEMKRAVD
jgi:ComEC/Rec2-related protein